jgi:hypothetical protein
VAGSVKLAAADGVSHGTLAIFRVSVSDESHSTLLHDANRVHQVGQRFREHAFHVTVCERPGN